MSNPTSRSILSHVKSLVRFAEHYRPTAAMDTGLLEAAIAAAAAIHQVLIGLRRP
jgi:hypothetical protein